MDILISCPNCGTEMMLPEGVAKFSCVECGEELFYVAGKVITRSAAKALLQSLIAKRQARLDAEAKAQAEAEAAAAADVAMPYGAPVEEEAPIKRPALKADDEDYNAPALQPRFNEEPKASAAYMDDDLRDIIAEPMNLQPTAAPMEPVAEQKEEVKAEGRKANKDTAKTKGGYAKSGAGFATFLYVLATAIYGAWLFYARDIVKVELGKLLVGAFGDEIGTIINSALTIYFFVLILLMWVCASSSFMSLGCVRKKINTKAELIASAATIVNIPNLPLMGILAANRKTFKKYRRTDKGTRFNFAPGYLATVAIVELIMIAGNVHWIYKYVLEYMASFDSSKIIEFVLSIAFSNAELTIIVAIISLSRLIKIMIRGKKMKQTFTSPI